MRSVTRRQVLGFRVRAQQIDRESGSLDGTAVLDIGVQDTGTDGARWALAVRGVASPAEDELATVWTIRGAPHVYRRADLPAVATATAPFSDADADADAGTTMRVLTIIATCAGRGELRDLGARLPGDRRVHPPVVALRGRPAGRRPGRALSAARNPGREASWSVISTLRYLP